MPTWVNVVVAISVFILIIFSIKAAFEFRAYCEAMAKHQEREAEFQDLSSDENSLNAYEREHFKLLMRGKFDERLDEGLAIWGRRLARRLKILRMISFISIVLIGIIYIGSEIIAKIQT